MTPRALLIGAPGAGKSTVGLALAERLGVAFRDSDADIERRAGKKIADIFIDEGEETFRAIETEVLAEAVTEFDGVVSLGGGVIMREANRALLAHQPVVWLEVSLTAAVKRVGIGATRPLLMGNVRGRLMELMAERTPIYTELAAVRVDTTDRSIHDVVEEIVEALEVHRG